MGLPSGQSLSARPGNGLSENTVGRRPTSSQKAASAARANSRGSLPASSPARQPLASSTAFMAPALVPVMPSKP
ncbi:MAG: hypothetical protein RLW42_09240, partial [Gammaproteobacteria bacterium]